MGLLKRIFGKGDEQSDAQVEREIEQINSGEVSKIYPILKPGDWVGIKAGCILQPLIGSPEEPLLVIGYGYDAPGNFVFLTPSNLDGKTEQEIFKQAYQNLEAYPSEFETSPALNDVLFASGRDFSSEKILCKDFMLKAQELLNTNELLVSIPRRRCLTIAAKNADEKVIDQFIILHQRIWEDDSYGNAPIINALFVVIDGEIDGMIPLDQNQEG